MMAIGKRIEKRLEELRWKRKDLLDRVDNLTVQALSNLIRRDSKRSEWDVKIADALGVSVNWLVYGTDEIPRNAMATTARYDVGLTPEEELVLRSFRRASPDAQAAMVAWARTVAPDQRDFIPGAGSQ